MALTDKLTHTVSVTAPGVLDDYGEPGAGTTVNSIPCYIDGRYRRYETETGRVVAFDYSILFLPSADIGVGYTVADGKDRGGNSLLLAGKIVGYEDSNHPRKGLVVREAFVERA